MTTTRWKVQPHEEDVGVWNQLVINENGDTVCGCATVKQAAQIVREHNAHTALVEIVELAKVVAEVWNNGHFDQDTMQTAVFDLEQAALRLAHEKGG